MISAVDRARGHGRRDRPDPLGRGREDRHQALIQRSSRRSHVQPSHACRQCPGLVRRRRGHDGRRLDARRPTTCSTGWSTSASRGPSSARPASSAMPARSASACRRAASPSSGRSCPSTSAAPRRPMTTAPGCARTSRSSGTARRRARSRCAILSDHFDEPDRLRVLRPDRGAPRDLAVGGALRDAHRQPPSRRRDLPRGGARAGPPSARRHVRRDGRRDRPGHGPDRPVARRPVPRHRPLPVRRRRSRPGRSSTTTTSSATSTSRTAGPRSWPSVDARGQGPRRGAPARRVLPARRGRRRHRRRSSTPFAAATTRGWLVVEQDQALGTSDTPDSVIAGQRVQPRVPAAPRGLTSAAG